MARHRSPRDLAGTPQQIARLTFEVTARPQEGYEEPGLRADLDGALLAYIEENYGELEAEISSVARQLLGSGAYANVTFRQGSLFIEVVIGTLAVIGGVKTAVESVGWLYHSVRWVLRRFFRKFQREQRFPYPLVVEIEGVVVPAPGLLELEEDEDRSRWEPLLPLGYLIVSHAALLTVVLILLLAKAF